MDRTTLEILKTVIRFYCPDYPTETCPRSDGTCEFCFFFFQEEGELDRMDKAWRTRDDLIKKEFEVEE